MRDARCEMQADWRKGQTTITTINNYHNFMPLFLTILFLDSAISRIMMRLYRTRAVIW